MTAPSNYRPAKADRIALVALMLLGAGIVVSSAVSFVSTTAAILGQGPHTVTANFFDLAGKLPLGPGGAEVSAGVVTATVNIPELVAPATGLLIAEAAVQFLAITTVIVCLVLLGQRALRGVFFGRGNTALIVTTGFAAIFGYMLPPILRQMGTTEALLDLSEGDFFNFMLALNPVQLFIAVFVFGIIATAYTVGSRVQRETEGLI
ncbi:hypothetical protein ACFSWE_02010 [Leucobacter albus]|uniref:DUF2975 family protein n=1 Tax=Leucobacter albus TaxID=272210 RepID=A0ABW3TML3_9MICO